MINKHKVQQVADPYSQEIKRLVKRTLIILGALALIVTLTVGFFASKLLFKNKKTELVETTPEPSVLNASTTSTQTPTSTATLSPTPSPSISLSASPTGSPSATTSSTPVASPSVSPSPTNLFTLQGDKQLDGYLKSDNSTNNNSEIKVGKDKNTILKGFLSFDLNSVPKDKQIDKATLKIYQAHVVGDLYKTLGNIKIDHLYYGTSLENSDYSEASFVSSFTDISSDKNTGWKTVDVTNYIKNDLSNSRSKSQFRIHVTNESASVSNENIANFESADNTLNTGNRPQIELYLK